MSRDLAFAGVVFGNVAQPQPIGRINAEGTVGQVIGSLVLLYLPCLCLPSALRQPLSNQIRQRGVTPCSRNRSRRARWKGITSMGRVPARRPGWVHTI